MDRTPLQQAEERFGTLEDKEYIVVFDLELTTWKEGDPLKRPMSEMEITEIGCVMLDAKTLKRVPHHSEFSINVRPTNFPILSEYCTELTGITQEMVDESMDLHNAVIHLRNVFLPPPQSFVWAAWGGDARWLQAELRAKASEDCIEFDPRYINVKLLDGKRRGLKKALKAYGIEQTLPAHRALPDAISTAELAVKLGMSIMDVQVSNSKTYQQQLNHKRHEMLEKFSHRMGLDFEFSKKLLEKSDWDYTTAKNWLTLFRDNLRLL